MLNANSSKPLYEQIKDYILHNIHSGEYQPHSRIPSERELSKRFGVSRLTVNKAIKELVQAGLLYVQIGKGTFISDETIDQQLDNLTSFTEEMTRRGQSTLSRIIRAESVPANKMIADVLRIPVGVNVCVLKRVRMANNHPVALEISYLIESLCPNLFNDRDFAKESLYHVLRTDYHLSLTHAEQTFEARSATKMEANLLDLEVGSPILHITRVTYTSENRPIEYVESAYRGDRYKFRAVLRQL